MEGHKGSKQKLPEKGIMQKLSLVEKWTRNILLQTELLCSQFAETAKCRNTALLLKNPKQSVSVKTSIT